MMTPGSAWPTKIMRSAKREYFPACVDSNKPNGADINRAINAPRAATEIVESAVSKSFTKSMGLGFPIKREMST